MESTENNYTSIKLIQDKYSIKLIVKENNKSKKNRACEVFLSPFDLQDFNKIGEILESFGKNIALMGIEGKLKECTKCGHSKPNSEFHKSTGSKDGYHTKCKTCRNLERKEDYINKKQLQCN